ncbi:MAG: TOBE domain-containing protein [Campylobacter sp.]|nr:TOBE domain-containing protein [Campylobacter sp.]MCI6340010.1 TOBE domain-containing protein [Campylobacter sp.]MDY4154422.1 TOBE domain-containing protein [Campylobacter sp.]
MLEKNINLEYISRIPLKLSAKNQLKVKILEINESIVNTDIIATLSTNEILKAKITKSSQKELGLKVDDEVIFIFKAPSVMIKKQDFSKLILPNLIKAKITSAIIGSQNCQITALTSDKQNLTAIIPNDVTMDLRLAVNDEIGVIIDPKDIIIGI